MNDDFKPIDAGAPVLIPAGNVNSDSPGSYGGMLKAYNAAKSGKTFTSKSSLHKDFKPGFGCIPDTEFQTMTNSTAI